jgi:hypothetical protein
MATPRTRTEFKEYCLRRLGHPVIQINIDDDQLDDRVDDALAFYHDYHYDGMEQMYLKHQITQEDMDRRYIFCPDAVNFVTGILPFDQSNSSVNMFDLRYQLRLHDLYDFTSVSYVSYEITMQHIRTLNLLFSGTPQVRFNRKMNRLHLDIDWTRDVNVGSWVIVECYRRIEPDSRISTGTVSVTAASNTVIGTGTSFNSELSVDDEIIINGEAKKIVSIAGAASLNVQSQFAATATGATLTRPGFSDVWNDRFLKQYATAKIKYQWGSNLSKFAGIQMPGGVTLDGVRIMQEAAEEMKELEEGLINTNVLPAEIMMG